MPIPPKPFGMNRREFLQFAGSGLLFSTLAAQTTWAGAAEDVTFISEGLSLTLHFPAGGRRCATPLAAEPEDAALNGSAPEPRSSRCLRRLGRLSSEMDVIARRTHAPGCR